ncbi:HAD family phosphatase [Bacillus sp. DNRA2]|uniref:Cof-type HAD-IIB family hydrolase n=1 Tax=Bacillus sp. DNRA2 TaxID=2723053 RepID=UPI00145E3CA3|nr:Cof-type HAD-IIB family hydrolase [Bacillus sp. DNRA2]NMD69173.1 HAD family phosphatase [Bacillus sp. DNRA2]
MNSQTEIKLIALDMDGTLLNEKGEVSEANREVITTAQANGVHVICSTGRSIITSRDYVKDLQLKSYHVTVNGSEVWGENGELIQRKVLDAEHINWMFQLAKEYSVHYWATATDRVWRREMPANIANHTWLKFGYEIADDEVRATILDHLQRKNDLFELSNSSPINIEINLKGVNKAHGVEVVCERLNIGMNQVMAIGDSLNDLPMIEAAGLGIAMGNAQDDVKKKADWVTTTNMDDGVAVAIRKWVLK